jgi:hypothetical protein
MGNKDFAALGKTLRRVRLGERPTEEGGKKVWHQGDKGVEVVSFVDAQGRVLRQEVHVGKEVVIWKAGKPVTTGEVPGEGRDANVSRSDLIVPHAEISKSAVFNALALLNGAGGDDKYLGHVRHALEAVAAGLSSDDDDSVVTSMQKKASIGDDSVEVTGSGQVRGANGPFLLVAGAVGLGLVAGVLYLVFLNK